MRAHLCILMLAVTADRRRLLWVPVAGWNIRSCAHVCALGPCHSKIPHNRLGPGSIAPNPLQDILKSSRTAQLDEQVIVDRETIEGGGRYAGLQRSLSRDCR